MGRHAIGRRFELIHKRLVFFSFFYLHKFRSSTMCIYAVSVRKEVLKGGNCPQVLIYPNVFFKKLFLVYVFLL